MSAFSPAAACAARGDMAAISCRRMASASPGVSDAARADGALCSFVTFTALVKE